MKPSQITTVLLSLAPLTSAWPGWLPDLDALIVRRQDDATTTASSVTATQTASTTSKATITTTNLNTGGITQSATATDDSSSSNSTEASASSTTYDATNPVGSVVLQTPVTTASSALYKIGEYVTFGWNYTNVLATPTAVDVLVSCATASETWTLTQNMTYETKGSFTWDTGAYQSTAAANPLLTEEYTLIIYDADSSSTDTGEAGYLGAYSGLTFGLYTGRPYTPLASGWVCATCSGALSENDKRALGFALTMAGITTLSFTWFVTGLW